jgi:hypothetical protein
MLTAHIMVEQRDGTPVSFIVRQFEGEGWTPRALDALSDALCEAAADPCQRGGRRLERDRADGDIKARMRHTGPERMAITGWFPVDNANVNAWIAERVRQLITANPMMQAGDPQPEDR